MPGGSTTILLLHADQAARGRISELLAPHNITCVDADPRDRAVPYLVPPEVGTIILQITPAHLDHGVETITRLRRHCPDARIIALASGRDLAVARSVYRAGVWDCLDESLDEDDLVCSITQAVRERKSPRPTPGGAAFVGDGITPLPGHRAFLDALAGLRSDCRQNGRPLAVMMLDLDRFRDCNERYSPACGDHVLRWFAALLAGACRRSDIVTRYQSDRFIVALSGSKAAHAKDMAHRCRQLMLENPVICDGVQHEMTMSAGIAESTAGFIETEQQLIRRARIALDHAKHRGGNRVVVWRELLDSEPHQKALNQLSADTVSFWMRRMRQQLRSTYLESTRALVAAVEAKDPFTQAHSLTVATYAEEIGKRMKLSSGMLGTIRAAALLHDVGKIGVPDAILTKAGPLTTDEFEIVKRHPDTALDILGHVSFLMDERPMILHHHERYDGRGYPGGLAGDAIPIGARILAVADALEAMFSPRSYKPAYGVDRVRAELTAGAGSQFDPAVTEVALERLDETPRSHHPPVQPQPLEKKSPA